MILIGIFLSLVLGYLASRTSRKNYIMAMTIIGCILFLSEIWKQGILTYRVYEGSYCVWYFPFQLCSIPLYLCPCMLLLKERGQRRIQVFLMTFTLLGGLAAFLDTSGMHYSLPILTIHSYLWHWLLIFIGSWSGFLWRREHRPVDKEASARWKPWMQCLWIWLVCIALATIFNVLLWNYGEINMFYISPYEASSQMIVRDIAARWGIHVANLGYLLAMLTGAWILYILWDW